MSGSCMSIQRQTAPTTRVFKQNKPKQKLCGCPRTQMSKKGLKKPDQAPATSVPGSEYAYRRVWEINQLLVPKPHVCITVSLDRLTYLGLYQHWTFLCKVCIPMYSGCLWLFHPLCFVLLFPLWHFTPIIMYRL